MQYKKAECDTNWPLNHWHCFVVLHGNQAGSRICKKRGPNVEIGENWLYAEFAWFSCQKGGGRGGQGRISSYLDLPLETNRINLSFSRHALLVYYSNIILLKKENERGELNQMNKNAWNSDTKFLQIVLPVLVYQWAPRRSVCVYTRLFYYYSWPSFVDTRTKWGVSDYKGLQMW